MTDTTASATTMGEILTASVSSTAATDFSSTSSDSSSLTTSTTQTATTVLGSSASPLLGKVTSTLANALLVNSSQMFSLNSTNTNINSANSSADRFDATSVSSYSSSESVTSSIHSIFSESSSVTQSLSSTPTLLTKLLEVTSHKPELGFKTLSFETVTSSSKRLIFATSTAFREVTEAATSSTQPPTLFPSSVSKGEHSWLPPFHRSGLSSLDPRTTMAPSFITYQSSNNGTAIYTSIPNDSDQPFIERYNPLNWEESELENFALVFAIAGMLIFGLICAVTGFCFGCWSERRRRFYEQSSIMLDSSSASRTGSGGRHHQVIHFGEPGCHDTYYNGANSITTRSAKGNCIMTDCGSDLNNFALLGTSGGSASHSGTQRTPGRTMVLEGDHTLQADRI